VVKVLQRYWRFSRGLTLGVQGVVIDRQARVLLVRHGYHPGWHFPGGGVEKGETVERALARELEEEVGVRLTGPSRLVGLYANFKFFPGDHIALFLVERWEQPRVPASNVEVAEQGFFELGELPEGLVPGARRRLAEIFEGAEGRAEW
jgi:ADP-ribose pyrophosphatase YjhB (NUDIX family)